MPNEQQLQKFQSKTLQIFMEILTLDLIIRK